MRKNYFILEEKDSESLSLDSEKAYLKSDIIKEMEENKISNIHVFLATRDNSMDAFYCKKDHEIFDVYDDNSKCNTCGKNCYKYTPKNGKNGCCKYRRSLYIPSTEYILYVDGTLEELKKEEEEAK